MSGVWTFPSEQKRSCLIPLLRGTQKKNPSFEWMNDQWTFAEKKNGKFSWWLKISKKKPLVFYWRFLICYGNESEIVTGSSVMSRAKFQKLSRALFVFHGHFFCYFVTGNPSIFTGKIWGFLSRALFQNHGHFFKKCHGQTENCHGEKNKHCIAQLLWCIFNKNQGLLLHFP